jgi:hypothetical protein
MLNHVVLAIEVVLLAILLALTVAIRKERLGEDNSVPWWLDTNWRRRTGPLTEHGRVLWWLRVLCIGLFFSAILLLGYDK